MSRTMLKKCVLSPSFREQEIVAPATVCSSESTPEQEEIFKRNKTLGARHVFASKQEAACRGSLYAAHCCPLAGGPGQHKGCPYTPPPCSQSICSFLSY
jgi:hypothetical protein